MGGGMQLLVSTNDSRVRLINMSDYSLQWKYRGIVNKSMQLRSSFSDDGKYIISGSEDGNIVVWDTVPPRQKGRFFKGKPHRNDCREYFACPLARSSSIPGAADTNVSTAALFAPSSSLDFAKTLMGDCVMPSSARCNHVIVSADYDGVINVYVSYRSAPH